MKLTSEQKKNYVDAISKEILKRPLNKLFWEETNTILCNIIARKGGDEFEDDEATQLINYVKNNRKLLPKIKQSYDWMEE